MLYFDVSEVTCMAGWIEIKIKYKQKKPIIDNICHYIEICCISLSNWHHWSEGSANYENEC